MIKTTSQDAILFSQQFSLWTRLRRRVRAPGLQGGGFAEVVGRVPSPGGTEAIIMRIAGTAGMSHAFCVRVYWCLFVVGLSQARIWGSKDALTKPGKNVTW